MRLITLWFFKLVGKRHPIWLVLCCKLLLSLFSALAKSVHVIPFLHAFYIVICIL